MQGRGLKGHVLLLRRILGDYGMLSLEEIKALDRSGLHRAYERWPAISHEALKLDVNAPDVKEVGRIVFAGMGGSATAGDVLSDWLSPSTKIPIHVVKDYHLPKFVGKDALVLVSSVSGDTAEALCALGEALRSGCVVATISAGGLLEDVSRRRRIPHTKIRCLLVPRATLPYIFYAAAKILMACKLIGNVEGELLDSVKSLEMQAPSISAKEPLDRNPSKRVAAKIHDGLPVICGSMLSRSVATRFKDSLNENARMHAIVEILPELCHNGIAAWDVGSKLFRPLLIRCKDESPEVKEGFEGVREAIEAQGFDVLEVWPIGGPLLGEIMSAIYMLDFASIYASVLRGIEPAAESNMDALKRSLRSRPGYRALYADL